MQNRLDNLLAPAPSQLATKQSARALAREAARLASPRQDKVRREEFVLPPEQDRGPPLRRSRDVADQTGHIPEGRDRNRPPGSASRRDDPPRREELLGRTQESEPPRRTDPPRRSERPEGAPPRRQAPPGLTKSEQGSCGEASDIGETKPTGTIHQVAGEPSFDEIVQSLADVTAEVEGELTEAVQASVDDTALSGRGVDPEAQAPSVPQDAPTEGQTTTGEAHVQLTPSGETDAASSPSETSAPRPEQAAAIHDGVHEPDAQGCATEREAREEEVRPGSEAAPPLPVQVAAAPEQATTAMAPSAAPTGDQSQPTTLPETSAITQRVDAIGAQGISVRQEHGLVGAPGTSAHQEQTSVTERAEPAGENRRDASAEARNETSGSVAGTDAKPAPKADQTWFGSPPASSGTPPRVPSTEAPVPNAPIRVVSEVPLGAVPVEIGLKSLAGINHFEIRLDPVELGRIEVRLEIDAEGGVKAHLSVDRVETLALLQRDAKTLERAFDQAGLKLSDGSVDLSLRDQHSQGQRRHEHAGDERRDGSRRPGPEIRHEHADPPLADAPRRLWGRPAGIDVRI
jgi:flagellar hook-length control protein FliK